MFDRIGAQWRVHRKLRLLFSCGLVWRRKSPRAGCGCFAGREVSGDRTSKIEIRRLTNERFETLFVFDHAHTARVAPPLLWPDREFRDLLEDRSHTVRVGTGGLVVEQPLAAREIWVAEFERK